MFVVAVLMGVLLFALLAGVGLWVDGLNADELNSMGIERRS